MSNFGSWNKVSLDSLYRGKEYTVAKIAANIHRISKLQNGKFINLGKVVQDNNPCSLKTRDTVPWNKYMIVSVTVFLVRMYEK
jgi:hypothetical protein